MNIEQELASALDVDPSPEFVSRVRVRIAHEPEPTGDRWLLAIVAAGCVATAILATFSAVRVVRPEDAPTTVAARQEAAPARPETVAPIVTRPHPMPDRGRTRKAVPQVMVSTAESQGLSQLFVAITDGRVTLAAFPTDATYVMVESPRGETIVGPMQVEPIAAIMDSEGVRQ